MKNFQFLELAVPHQLIGIGHECIITANFMAFPQFHRKWFYRFRFTNKISHFFNISIFDAFVLLATMTFDPLHRLKYIAWLWFERNEKVSNSFHIDLQMIKIFLVSRHLMLISFPMENFQILQKINFHPSSNRSMYPSRMGLSDI